MYCRTLDSGHWTGMPSTMTLVSARGVASPAPAWLLSRGGAPSRTADVCLPPVLLVGGQVFSCQPTLLTRTALELAWPRVATPLVPSAAPVWSPFSRTPPTLGLSVPTR